MEDGGWRMEVVVKINEERIYVVCNPAHWLKRINV